MLNYFPKDFVWGAAASAFQIEGAAFEGGKGANKHDHILRDPDLKHHYNGTRLPDVCADFYHLYPEDIKLFKELGLKSDGLHFSSVALREFGIRYFNVYQNLI